jgi:hypothetical protein
LFIKTTNTQLGKVDLFGLEELSGSVSLLPHYFDWVNVRIGEDEGCVVP